MSAKQTESPISYENAWLVVERVVSDFVNLRGLYLPQIDDLAEALSYYLDYSQEKIERMFEQQTECYQREYEGWLETLTRMQDEGSGKCRYELAEYIDLMWHGMPRE